MDAKIEPCARRVKRLHRRLAARLFLLAAAAAASGERSAAAAGPEGDAAPRKPFTIIITDAGTGRGVPLVELKTVDGARHWSDSAGVVAFDEPGLMGETVFFHVASHGYQFPADGFGYRGAALKVAAGGRAELKIQRLNVAERLYRVTGGGIYRDSLLAGLPVPLREPALNAQVFGSDSVVCTVYRGKIHWFWGDTNRPRYPLGNFHVPGATSLLPSAGGLDPEVGVDLEYFTGPDGFARETTRMPGKGPTWIGGLAALAGAGGRERLFAAYVKIPPGSLSAYEHGLVEFNDERGEFEKAVVFVEGAPVYPGGHPFRHRCGGVDYLYFATPYPLARVRADPEELKRLESYESFTPLLPGTTAADARLERPEGGRAAYAWRRGAPPLTPELAAKLIEAGKLEPGESILALRDADTGAAVGASSGSVAWNEYRRRWVMIASQLFGTSVLGETWYAEGDTPLGPWVYARKVVTHERYSFYNPKHHPFFDKEGGRIIFLEGTYATTFSGNTDATPRYDYNQVMYKLDLSDPRLALPLPVYERVEAGARAPFGTLGAFATGAARGRIAFFALDRPVPASVPVYALPEPGGGVRLAAGAPASPEGAALEPLFHALPADLPRPPATAAPLFEFRSGDGAAPRYSTDRDASSPGATRGERPVCLVWKNPLVVELPGE